MTVIPIRKPDRGNKTKNIRMIRDLIDHVESNPEFHTGIGTCLWDHDDVYIREILEEPEKVVHQYTKGNFDHYLGTYPK